MYGWKSLRRFAKNKKKLLCMVKQAKLSSKQNGICYKFGAQVPRNYTEAMRHLHLAAT